MVKENLEKNSTGRGAESREGRGVSLSHADTVSPPEEGYRKEPNGGRHVAKEKGTVALSAELRWQERTVTGGETSSSEKDTRGQGPLHPALILCGRRTVVSVTPRKDGT